MMARLYMVTKILKCVLNRDTLKFSVFVNYYLVVLKTTNHCFKKTDTRLQGRNGGKDMGEYTLL